MVSQKQQKRTKLKNGQRSKSRSSRRKRQNRQKLQKGQKRSRRKITRSNKAYRMSGGSGDGADPEFTEPGEILEQMKLLVTDMVATDLEQKAYADTEKAGNIIDLKYEEDSFADLVAFSSRVVADLKAETDAETDAAIDTEIQLHGRIVKELHNHASSLYEEIVALKRQIDELRPTIDAYKSRVTELNVTFEAFGGIFPAGVAEDSEIYQKIKERDRMYGKMESMVLRAGGYSARTDKFATSVRTLVEQMAEYSDFCCGNKRPVAVPTWGQRPASARR